MSQLCGQGCAVCELHQQNDLKQENKDLRAEIVRLKSEMNRFDKVELALHRMQATLEALQRRIDHTDAYSPRGAK